MLKNILVPTDLPSSLILKVIFLVFLVLISLVKYFVIIVKNPITPILDADFITQNHLTQSGKLKVLLTSKDPIVFGYLKIEIDLVLQEHRTRSKGKWYLKSACSNHMRENKSLFKSVADHDGGKICLGGNSSGTVISVGIVSFNK